MPFKVLPNLGLPGDCLFILNQAQTSFISNNRMVIELMIEDQELVGLVSITEGKVNVTDKGRDRLEEFRKTLSQDEIEALKL